MNVVTLLPFLVVAGIPLAALVIASGRRRTAEERDRREQGFVASLPPRSTPQDQTNRLALEALDRLCGLSGSVPWQFVDMTGYFQERSWNRADVYDVMGRLEALGFAQQEVTATHPISPYRYRATDAGVRENMANAGRRETGPQVHVEQTNHDGHNIANVNSRAWNSVEHRHTRREEVSEEVSLERLVRLLREEAARAPQDVSVNALSHADNLDTALAGGGRITTDEAVGRIQQFLLTAGAGFGATQQLLQLLGR
ncbi:hypothetical protein ACGFYV_26370 [Streptomyces sp. NPDC048297]|uniref:hypothetical protein n=1 Tax=Streptomyces sp. NPDC048297 TaxID=3365531 RepID=UPI00371D3D2C